MVLPKLACCADSCHCDRHAAVCSLPIIRIECKQKGFLYHDPVAWLSHELWPSPGSYLPPQRQGRRSWKQQWRRRWSCQAAAAFYIHNSPQNVSVVLDVAETGEAELDAATAAALELPGGSSREAGVGGVRWAARPEGGLDLVHQQALASLAWHARGDYFATVAPAGNTQVPIETHIAAVMTTSVSKLHCKGPGLECQSTGHGRQNCSYGCQTPR